ncbi:hypothetical protein BpHYR1_049706 [Brachionus plicatilis]|uniref:Uncharacterized protein n=1 Tax=Brachionus plicatilis TaxID=10195 RepID=A0A3M7QKV2_BRAPC|nr:hypothetical protein BpHYR1_049706 [Brachionus plicatilis]
MYYTKMLNNFVASCEASNVVQPEQELVEVPIQTKSTITEIKYFKHTVSSYLNYQSIDKLDRNKLIKRVYLYQFCQTLIVISN